jgi:hypothetical protein
MIINWECLNRRITYNRTYNDAHLRYEPFVGKKVAQTEENGKLVMIHDSQCAVARAMNVNNSTARCWCRSDKLHRGFYWNLVS